MDDQARWSVLERVFHKALELDSGERAEYIQTACGNDEGLRRRVESLLQHDNLTVPGEASPGMPGPRIGPYQVVAKLGAGGMGEVYLARDSRLDRQVAVKILSPQFANDPERKRRFLREAKAASALNHPNIVTVHDVGTDGALDYLVMEYVAGKPLDRLIPRDGLKGKEALEYAIQIANALACAHAAGIIHRDLKPANVLISEGGMAKVVDFGLAKRVLAGPDGGTLTQDGLIVGTVAYMSPEQAEGKPVDARSDIFSFGSLLYKMITGRHAFQRETAASTLAAVLREEPQPITPLSDDAPAELGGLIERCLRKDPADRFQTMAEVGVALKSEQEELSAVRRAPVRRRSTRALRPWLLAIGVCAAVLALAVAMLTFTKRGPVAVPQLKQRRLTTNSSENPVRGGAAISPDGKYLAYGERNGLHVKLIETGETQTIPQPEGLSDSRRVQWRVGPWFPTGTRFLANAHPPGQDEESAVERKSIWVVSLLGGTPRKLRDGAEAFSVSPDGAWIAFGTHSGGSGYLEIWLMRPNGEQAHKLFETDKHSSIGGLQWLANGERVIYVKSDESGDALISRDMKGAPARALVSFRPWSLRDYICLPDGRVLYVLSDPGSNDKCNYWQIRVNAQTGEMAERPKQLTNWAGFCMDSTSATADGKRLSFVRWSAQSSVYIAGLEPGGRRITNPRHLTLSDSFNYPVDWTADSKAVVFLSNRDGQWAAFRQPRDADTAEPIVARAERVTNARVSPDGAWVLYGVPANDGRSTTRLNRMPTAGGPSESLLAEAIDDHFCAKSPATLCVIGEPSHNQLIFSALDVFKGRGRELARFDIDPKASYGASWYSWALSPDGTRIAILRDGENRVHVLSLNGQPQQDITIKNWDAIRHVTWAANGKGVFVSTQAQRAAVLLYVDLKGNSEVLWKQEGGLGTYAIPSPDGHHLAMQGWTLDNNAWMLEDF